MEFDWKKYQGDRFKFEQPGDRIAGVLVNVTEQEPFNGEGSSSPKLTIRTADGVERDVIASQTDLQRKLAQQAPSIGAHIDITFTESVPLGGGKTAKKFAVTVGAAANTPAPSSLA